MHALEMIFGHVLRLSGESAVLAIVIYAVGRIFRRWLSPAWRYALWGLVAVRLLVPYGPQSPISIFNAENLFPTKRPAQSVAAERPQAKDYVALSTAPPHFAGNEFSP